jgi:hypothetical protein
VAAAVLTMVAGPNPALGYVSRGDAALVAECGVSWGTDAREASVAAGLSLRWRSAWSMASAPPTPSSERGDSRAPDTSTTFSGVV